jgi:hypothetical protein
MFTPHAFWMPHPPVAALSSARHDAPAAPKVEGFASLGLPLASVSLAWAAVLLLLAAYALSMARDLASFDSPELALAALRLGLGHPPGQPLHTLLGFVFAHLPGLPALLGMNLLSALAGALCALPALSLAQTLLGDARPAPGWLVLAIILPVGLHPALWEPATRVEVYTLAAFCGLWALARVAQPARRSRDFFWAGLALGLGACANPYVSLIVALALAPGVLLALVRRQLSPRAIPLACAGGCVGLLPYLYVPWVAARPYTRGVMVWGAPIDAESLRHYFLGLDYARSRGISGAEWLRHTADWFVWAAQRGLLPLLLAGLLGVLFAERRSLLLVAALPISTGLAVLLVASNTVWQPDIPDYVGYLVIPAWFAAAGLLALLARLQYLARPVLAIALVLAQAAWCLSLPPAVWTRTRQLDRVARTLAQAALAEAPPHAFLIVEADHWVAPLLYLQWAEHVREDVVIVALGLASSSWFWQQTFAFHPELRPAALAGPGGRNARVRRMLAANSERSVLIETGQLASQLAIEVCVTGWLRTVKAGSCAPPSAAVDAVLRRQAFQLGEGAPPALAILSSVAFERGLDLWARANFAAADRALLAAVPAESRPTLTPLPASLGPHVLPPPAIAWQRAVALGEPARNLYLASLLRAELGDVEGASALALAAARTGLPEAQRWLR